MYRLAVTKKSGGWVNADTNGKQQYVIEQVEEFVRFVVKKAELNPTLKQELINIIKEAKDLPEDKLVEFPEIGKKISAEKRLISLIIEKQTQIELRKKS